MEPFNKIITDVHFIQKLIPQKFPFVMVDKLLHFEEKKVVSGLIISEENILVEDGHFTEAGIIENMAQSSALHTGYRFFGAEGPVPTGYIGAIKKVEIVDLPLVGEELITTVELLHEIMGITLLSAQTVCCGKIIATCEMKTVLAG